MIDPYLRARADELLQRALDSVEIDEDVAIASATVAQAVYVRILLDRAENPLSYPFVGPSVFAGPVGPPVPFDGGTFYPAAPPAEREGEE